MTTAKVKIVEGVDRVHVDDALRLNFDAFTKKFRIGFRNPHDLVRLFRDSVDTTSSFSAIVDGQLSGILAFQTTNRRFYRLNTKTVFSKFSPFRALLMLFNLALLASEDAVRADEFRSESLAVGPSFRGMGIGTSLLLKAEKRARSMDKRRMSLDVIEENEDAIRLYERLGSKTTRTWRGFFVRLAARSKEVRRMEKPLVGERPDDADGSANRNSDSTLRSRH